jgi:sirohydrochlorin ferrochelatase
MSAATRLIVVASILAFLLAFTPSPAESAAQSGLRPAEPDAPRFGVLVMAHGGTEAWNRSVREAVSGLTDRLPLSIAFGMADANTIADAVADLEARGVGQIAVVRLFISGASWFERTEQILGLRAGAPAAPDRAAGAHGAHSSHGDEHAMAFYRIDSASRFALSSEGLNEAPEVDEILEDRAQALSAAPSREDVLVLAHGVGTDEANERWRALIGQRAERMSAALPFRRVYVETLAEDWEEPRREAEQRVRDYVARADAEGGTAIVIPFRLSGFGPYAKVLEGLDYRADELGLLPHEAIAAWIERQVAELRAGPFRAPLPRDEVPHPRD